MDAEEWVADYFAVHGRMCNECRYLIRQRPGSEAVTEECAALDPPKHWKTNPEDCPAWQREQEDA